jgi:tetratricopeptide (TPR) repeat protein
MHVKLAALAALAACSASATLPELVQAEQRADAGDVAGSVAAYQRAQTTCRDLRPKRRAVDACRDALLGEGDVVDHAGRTADAIAIYLAIPARTTDPTAAATAFYRAGDLLMRDHQTVPAWTALWKVVTDYPDEPLAADALKAVVADGRHRDVCALADQLEKLLTPLAQTGVADNILWWLADLTEHELGNPKDARAMYDRIYTDYPQSGLRDDARWHAARLSRALGDSPGAVTRLRGLLATREVSWLAGSYFSIWLDDAQLELGKILRDDLHDPTGAIAAFRKLPKDYPTSVLRDDALYELAVTFEQTHDAAGACKAVADLVKLEPDSKYRARADAIAADSQCK